MSIERLRKAIKDKNLVLGERETLRNVKLGKTAVVFVSADCKSELKESLREYSAHGKVEIVDLDISAAEVGTICKKQFPISVLSY